MELIYLWIEEYKNIKNQGFNFSPKFNCQYDKEKKEITIKENKEHINIFPNNINITVIVGKNGSGKSNLITSIIGTIFQNNDNWREIKEIIFIYKINDSYCIYTFSNTIATLNISANKNYEIYSLYKKEYEPQDILKKAYYLYMDFSIGQNDLWNDDKNYKKDFSMEPSRIYKSSGGAGITSKIEPASYDSNMRVNVLYFFYFINKHNLNTLLNEFKLPNFDILTYTGKSQKGKKTKEEKFSKIKNKKIFNIDFSQFNSYDKIGNYFNEHNFNFNISDIKEEDLLYIEDLLIFINLEMKTDEDYYFWHLSTGQKTLLSYMGIIIRTYLKLKVSDNFSSFYIFIDEYETSLHPIWQKKFLSFIITLLDKAKMNKEYFIQLIINSHSPFLLSDIPKENIIFLDNGKNISDEVEIQTFGANIHTLLTHSFFMEDGLMGEFAREKIDNVIKLLNSPNQLSDNEIKKCEEIISIIGEPIIKRQLQKMLDSKKMNYIAKDVKEEIEFLQHRIDILSKRL